MKIIVGIRIRKYVYLNLKKVIILYTSRMTSSIPSFEYESIRLLGFASVSEYQAFDMKSHLMTSAGLRGLYLFRPGDKPANITVEKKRTICIMYISNLQSLVVRNALYTQQVWIAQVFRTPGTGREEF